VYKGYNDVKIKSFFDHETYGVCPGGGTYITATWAKDQAEEFINLPNINVIDIQFVQKEIHVIYREELTNG
jgi:hypothetical protein